MFYMKVKFDLSFLSEVSKCFLPSAYQESLKLFSSSFPALPLFGVFSNITWISLLEHSTLAQIKAQVFAKKKKQGTKEYLYFIHFI